MSLEIGLIVSVAIIVLGGVFLAAIFSWFREKHSIPKEKPAYEHDDGPLSPNQIDALRQDSSRHLPGGKTLRREDLFPADSTRLVGPLIEPGSTNVYTDIGYHDPEKMQRKATLASSIICRIDSLQLTQEAAARLLDVDQATMEKIVRGQFRNISESLLMGMVAILSQPGLLASKAD
nr:XRE family transcriptional regulator [Rhodoferax sp.]